MSLKIRIIPCLDVKDCTRRPQPQRGEDAQNERTAVLCH